MRWDNVCKGKHSLPAFCLTKRLALLQGGLFPGCSGLRQSILLPVPGRSEKGWTWDATILCSVTTGMEEHGVCALKTVSKKESLEQKCCGVVLEKSKNKQKHAGIISPLHAWQTQVFASFPSAQRPQEGGDTGPGVGDPQQMHSLPVTHSVGTIPDLMLRGSRGILATTAPRSQASSFP